MILHPDAFDQLNHLIHVNKDSAASLTTAAENVRNTQLESLLSGYAKNHSKFADELQVEVERLGGTASDTGTVGGALYRGWLDVKSSLSGHSPTAMLTACEAGEQSADAAYAGPGDISLPGQTHSLIDKQRKQIREMHKHLCRLVEEARNGVEFQTNE